MAGLSVELDGNGSLIGGGNPGGAYALSEANGYALLSFDDPGPEPDYQWASSAETEGELLASGRHRNRTVTLRYRLAKSTDALVETEISALSKKLHKLEREGGTMSVTYPSGTVGYFDVRASRGQLLWDHRILRIRRGEITLTLICAPYIRTAEVDLGDNTETTLPVLIFTEASIPGDVPALGRLEVDNDGATSCGGLAWGIQSRRYDAAASAALFFEAEANLGFDAVAAAGTAPASGSGNNVARDTSLFIGQLALINGTHVGNFRVFARFFAPSSNTGILSARAQYTPAANDLVSGDEVALVDYLGAAIENEWVIVDLGLVHFDPAIVGTQLSTLEIWVNSTVTSDDVDCDWIALFPVDEGYGMVTSNGIAAGATIGIRHDVALINFASTTLWGRPRQYAGDYLRIPPSGTANRTLRVITMFLEDRTLYGDRVYPSPTIDDLSAHLWVTPRWLSMPD
jgi:hypothetical protein